MTDKVRQLLFVFVTILFLSRTAFAAEYDGYIVKINTRPQMFSIDMMPELKQLEEIWEPEGIYQTADFNAIEKLKENGFLEYAEPNYLVFLEGRTDPRGLLGKNLWYMDTLNMSYCWNRNITGEGVRVGLIDSGLFAEHIDFQNSIILPGKNYCISNTNGEKDDTNDTYGHGTFSGGLIAATGGDDGVMGLAPAVELVPLKCFNGKSGSVANIITAIYDAVDTYHCQVINLSFGIRQNSTSLREAVEYAFEKDTVLVAAAGNISGNSSSDDPLYYPAAYPQVIGVGAVDQDQTVCDFSCQNAAVWVCAPGSGLWSLSCHNANGYVTDQGTSFSTALVTASAALALSQKPDLTPQEIADLIAQTSQDMGTLGYDFAYGHGVLNIGRLMDALSPANILGDLTGDGKISMGDVVRLARAVGGYLELTEQEQTAGDVTGDGKIGIGDVVKLARYVAHYIPSLE